MNEYMNIYIVMKIFQRLEKKVSGKSLDVVALVLYVNQNFINIKTLCLRF